MESLRHLYRIGHGPSSSHTMGPVNAVQQMKARFPGMKSLIIELFDSLAKTGKGHLTDKAMKAEAAPIPCEVIFNLTDTLPGHPNGMKLTPRSADCTPLSAPLIAYSIGGGALRFEGESPSDAPAPVYPLHTMAEILTHCEEQGLPFWKYVRQCEGPEIFDYLQTIWSVMQEAIEAGLDADGMLEGGLRVQRRAHVWNLRAKRATPVFQKNVILGSYALAVAEHNAAAGIIVTAPTCGSAGVLPAVLRSMTEFYDIREPEILRALATAGLVGNLVKYNASISGAEAGCQAEIGVASAMAAAAAAQLLGGTPRQIEYAAEMGLEHHLGLTCDPINGLVQIPCIERNAFAAMRSMGCAEFAVISDGSHRVPFDAAVETLRQTGRDMCSRYRETAEGGLAKVCHNC